MLALIQEEAAWVVVTVERGIFRDTERTCQWRRLTCHRVEGQGGRRRWPNSARVACPFGGVLMPENSEITLSLSFSPLKTLSSVYIKVRWHYFSSFFQSDLKYVLIEKYIDPVVIKYQEPSRSTSMETSVIFNHYYLGSTYHFLILSVTWCRPLPMPAFGWDDLPSSNCPRLKWSSLLYRRGQDRWKLRIDLMSAHEARRAVSRSTPEATADSGCCGVQPLSHGDGH